MESGSGPWQPQTRKARAARRIQYDRMPFAAARVALTVRVMAGSIPPMLFSRERAALTWALVLMLDLVTIAPRIVFGNRGAGSPLFHPANRPRLPGIGYELGLLLCLLLLAAGWRFRRALR